jgi:flagella basal body P-ring formation protein FlgA
MHHFQRSVLYLRLLLLSLLISSSVFAIALKSEYAIDALDFNASAIDPQVDNDFLIYRFDQNRHKKSFTSSRLLQIFEDQGMQIEDASGGIVHVERTSNVDLEPVVQKVKAYYHSYFPDMHIEKVFLDSSSFIEKLPRDYTLVFKSKAYLYNHSSFKLLTEGSTERFFIRYKIQAKMKLFKARHNINRGKILTPKDILSVQAEFKRLKGLPLVSLTEQQVRVKKRLAKGKILYQHDIEPLPSVLKDKPVTVRFISGKVHLEFQATSLDDAGIGEYVYIEKSDGKKLKAKVIHKNLVEIE